MPLGLFRDIRAAPAPGKQHIAENEINLWRILQHCKSSLTATGLQNLVAESAQDRDNKSPKVLVVLPFMIPYFISFLILGIPLMWIEWGIGRFGGTRGHGTIPGMFDALTDGKKKWAKYVGVLGLVMPLVIFIYYTYIVSWMLGFSFFSITGGYFGLESVEGMRGFLGSYQDIFDSSVHGPGVTIGFFLVTIAFLGWVLGKGISGGIEKLALIGMPVLRTRRSTFIDGSDADARYLSTHLAKYLADRSAALSQ